MNKTSLALLHEGLRRIGGATIPETDTILDPVIAAGTAMAIAGVRQDHHPLARADMRTETAIAKGIARPNTTAEAGVTVAVAAEVAALDEDAITDKKAEK
ncbi:hypothetical protein BJX96DRAFT_151632 [Aspergillus floccosus]